MAPASDGPVPSLTLSEAEESARRSDFARLATDIEDVAKEHETRSALRNADEHTSRRIDAYGML